MGLHPTFLPVDGGASPTNPFQVTMTWNSGVTGFDLSDMTVTNGAVTNLSGGSKTFVFTVTAAGEGEVVIQIPAGVATNENGELSLATEYNVRYDTTGASVTVDKAVSQASQTGTLPVNFDVVFNETVNPASFTAGDIVNDGTATGVTWTITDSGDHRNYTLAATAISGNAGTLKPTVAAGAILDDAGNASNVSTSTDNTVYYLPGYTSLKLWLRADSLVQANGTNVTSWADSSAAGMNVAEVTNPPTFLTPAQNSLPAVTFNGSDVLRSATSSGITGNPDMSVFLVSRLNSVGASNAAYLQIGESVGAGNAAWMGMFNTTSNLYTGFMNGAVVSTSNVPGTFRLSVWIRNSASGTALAQAGNTQFWNGASATVTTAFSNPTVSLTDGALRIGRSSWGATVDADIAEILLFNGIAMSASDRAMIEGYLRVKYNLYTP